MAGPEADLATLRESVTSKGGTTAAALAAFTAKDLESVVATAVEAAVNRGRELASQAARGG
jgi:pyrroline-5-carboxylate reductase